MQPLESLFFCSFPAKVVASSTSRRLDYQPLFGKGVRAPPPNSGRVDQTRESGGNRAYTSRQMKKAVNYSIHKSGLVATVIDDSIVV